MANDNVCFSAKKGEIHAICGENGAGKSTLMKLLFGVEQPNQGRIIMRGQEVKLTSPMKAIEMGIGMVYQYFMLVSSLTVAENMMLGIEPKRGIRFDRDKAVRVSPHEVAPARVSGIYHAVRQRPSVIRVIRHMREWIEGFHNLDEVLEDILFARPCWLFRGRYRVQSE